MPRQNKMSEFLKKIAQLPLDIQLSIFEYDPNRRIVLDKLCNMLRLYVPFWYFTKGSWTTMLHYDRSVIHEKDNTIRYIQAVSECCLCNKLKSSTMILEYLGNGRYYNGCGLYCDVCLNRLLTIKPNEVELRI